MLGVTRVTLKQSQILKNKQKSLHEEWKEYTIKMNKRSAKHPRIVPGRLKFKMSLALKKKCKEKPRKGFFWQC